MAPLVKLLSGLLWLFLGLAWSNSSFAYSKADCLELAKVKSWKGTYTITASNTGSASASDSGYQWNYQSSLTSNFTLFNSLALNGPIQCNLAFGPPILSIYLDGFGFSEDATSTGTMTGKEIVTNDNNCSSSGKTSTNDFQSTFTQTQTLNSIPYLSFSMANGTYNIVIDFADVAVIRTESSCGEAVSAVNMNIGPRPASFPVLAGDLPGASVTSKALKGSRTFTGDPPFSWRSAPGLTPTTWTETWDLQPVTSDTPAETKKEVEDPCLASGSIIGCENQSLGEAIALAGTPYRLHYQSNRTPGTTGANTVAVAYADDLGGWTFDVQHRYDPATNTLFMGNGAFRSSSSLGTVTPSATSGFWIASEDGLLVYEFNIDGLHTKTLSTLTGATILSFSYSATGGWLTSVTDGDGNVTSFTRNAQGKLLAIVGLYDQSSKVTLNKQGYITALHDSAGKSIKAKYAANGLLTAFTNASGMVSNFSYDAHGLLLKDKNSAGGKQTLSLNSVGDTVTHTTAGGRVTRYKTTVQTDGSIDRTVTEPTGLIRTMNKNAQLATSVTTSSGLQLAMTTASDTRFGNSASIPQTSTITTPGGISMSIATSREATLSDSVDPFSLTQQTETLQLNGKAFTSSFDAASKTLTKSSPAGRLSSTTVDSLGRITGKVIPDIDPVYYDYDVRGRLTSTSSGSGDEQRTRLYGYDGNGFLQSVIDPLNQTHSFSRNKLGQVVQQILSDGNLVKFAYDAGGRLQKLTNPAGHAYSFSYTKTGLLSSVTLPSASGAKKKESYTYNLDGQLIGKTRLDGTKLAYHYDLAGRLSARTSSSSTWTYDYDTAYGYLKTVTEPDGISLEFTRDGPLLQQLAWSGTMTGQVGFTYNNDFQIQTVSVNNANPITYGYDTDGLLSTVGAMSIQRSSQNASRTGSTLGSVQDSYTYNAFGKISHYQAGFNTSILMSMDYVYDKLGRIIQRTESLQGGATKTYSYTYDLTGQLTRVTDGTNTSTYSYDQNGNRLTFSSTADGTSATGSYDAQDRLLSYGNIKNGYSGNGEVISRIQGAQTTRLEYNLLGNLAAAVLPSGDHIDYLVDGAGMRIGRKINGTLQQVFLYQSNLRPVAELDGTGNIVSRFVYANRVNVPDYMIRGGATYRIITDHLGSPRLVVNVANGAVAQRMDYDEFGNVLQDTSPGFQPFGFAGGLYDRDTGLVHYGAREFDPKTGRWMSRDPILFAGGNINLYANLNDPVNTTDPSGLVTLAEVWSARWDRASAHLEQAVDWVKDKINSIAEPKATVGTEAGIDGVIEVSAEASIEVLTSGGAADDLLKGTVSVGAAQPILAKLPIIGGCFAKKIEASATVKIDPAFIDRMNTNVNKYNLAADGH